MNINKNNYILYFIIWLFFLMFCLFLNRNVIYLPDDALKIFKMNSTDHGFNSLRLHSTIFLVIYNFLLVDRIKLFNISYVSRIGRENTLIKTIKNMIRFSTLYVLIFSSAQLLVVILNIDFSLLICELYFVYFFQFFISFVILYSFIGILFVFFLVITKNEYIAILFNFTFNMLFVAIFKSYNHLTTVYQDTSVFDNLKYNSYTFTSWFLNIIKNIIIFSLIYYVTKIIYLKKDILCKTKN